MALPSTSVRPSAALGSNTKSRRSANDVAAEASDLAVGENGPSARWPWAFAPCSVRRASWSSGMYWGWLALAAAVVSICRRLVPVAWESPAVAAAWLGLGEDGASSAGCWGVASSAILSRTMVAGRLRSGGWSPGLHVEEGIYRDICKGGLKRMKGYTNNKRNSLSNRLFSGIPELSQLTSCLKPDRASCRTV